MKLVLELKNSKNLCCSYMFCLNYNQRQIAKKTHRCFVINCTYCSNDRYSLVNNCLSYIPLNRVTLVKLSLKRSIFTRNKKIVYCFLIIIWNTWMGSSDYGGDNNSTSISNSNSVILPVSNNVFTSEFLKIISYVNFIVPNIIPRQ